METKEELLQKIEYSETALATMQTYRQMQKHTDNNISICRRCLMDVEKSSKPLDEQNEDFFDKCKKAAKPIGWGFGIYTVLAFVVIVCCMASGTNPMPYVYTIFYTTAVVVAGVSIFKKVKKRSCYLTIDKPKLIKEYEEEIARLQEQSSNIDTKIKQYATTSEWITAVSYIPKDYFYVSAVEKIKFFLENGHADTMKEALLLYDEYLHRKKMEYEAKRAADNAEEASEYARINAEQTESLKFLTEMNLMTNVAIYKKLS